MIFYGGWGCRALSIFIQGLKSLIHWKQLALRRTLGHQLRKMNQTFVQAAECPNDKTWGGVSLKSRTTLQN